jgi:uncharacterized protein (DUF1778 family)
MPKDLFLKVRVTKSERDRLHMVARQNGKTLSGFIRSLTQQPISVNLNTKG